MKKCKLKPEKCKLKTHLVYTFKNAKTLIVNYLTKKSVKFTLVDTISNIFVFTVDIENNIVLCLLFIINSLSEINIFLGKCKLYIFSLHFSLNYLIANKLTLQKSVH